MLDHVSLGTNDFEAACRFYDTVLAALGYRRLFTFERTAGWGTEFPSFWVGRPMDGSPAAAGNGTHIALRARSRADVDEFHRLAVAAGATDDGPPGLRPYHPTYYAAFVRDPDGHKIEVVHHGS
jgi:catechol 2,3-dioxygenase-like lactoylglutathione lyase family enzyme